MRDYYLSTEEGRDLDSEIMRLYNKPLQPVVKLNESTLEQIQEHVMATEQAQALSNISDPMAFAKLFGRQGEASQVSKVSASRKNEEINKYKQAQQLLQDMVNSTNVIEKNVGPEPDKQLEVPQAGPLGMK